MRHEIVLIRNGYKQVLQVIAETYKKWKVWKVKFQDGTEAILLKCGSLWMQRNEDDLDRGLLNAIGERIDRLSSGISLS
jgi:hypothetical protein